MRDKILLTRTLLFSIALALSGCATTSTPVSYQTTNAFTQYMNNPPTNAGVVGLVFAPGFMEKYPAAAFFNSGKTICLSGQKIADIKMEQTIGLVLPPGQHQIVWDFDMDMFSGCEYGANGSRAVSVNVQGGEFQIISVPHPKLNGGQLFRESDITAADKSWFMNKQMVGTYIHPAALVNNSQQPATNTNANAMSTNEAIKECKELGFELGSEQLLKCVTDLSKN